MPYALVLDCIPQREAPTPENLQGQKPLALFLEELIEKQDAALAARLHAPRQSKPYTTAFRAAEAALPLPIPGLCFQSWLNSWDEYAPCPFFTDRAERRRFLEEVVEAKVSVTFPHIRMAAEAFYFDGHRTSEQGFTGSCRFSVKAGKTAPHQRKILSVLARYSFYAGTGRKNTMGRGVTTPVAPSTSGSR